MRSVGWAQSHYYNCPSKKRKTACKDRKTQGTKSLTKTEAEIGQATQAKKCVGLPGVGGGRAEFCPGGYRRSMALLCDFGLLASRTVMIPISVVLSYSVYLNVLR